MAGSKGLVSRRPKSINVKKEINRIPEATLVYHEGGIPVDQRFEISESGHFDIGNEVTIEAGPYDNTKAILRVL